MNDKKIFAIDFDGTLCVDKFPAIGKERPRVIEFVKAHKAKGDKFILWTCRSGKALAAAVEWCGQRGIEFDAVNANLPEHIEQYGGDTRKIFADYYIDDKNYYMDLREEMNEL